MDDPVTGKPGDPDEPLAKTSDILIESVDLDSDGSVDITALTAPDGSGIAFVDSDASGTVDTILEDLDADGVVEQAIRDVDEDGLVDIVQSDHDADAFLEETTIVNSGVTLTIDPITGLVVDSTEPASPSGDDPLPEVKPSTDVIPTSLEPDLEPMPADQAAYGDPGLDAAWGQVQSENGFCVPVSVGMIVSEFTGEIVSETQTVDAAVEIGVLYGEPGAWLGVTTEGTVQLLDHFGIESRVEYGGGDLESLEGYLEKNHGIILMVDSSELWDGVGDDKLTIDGSDHAVVVTGIDYERGVVTLNDPGQGEGVRWEVSIEDFMEAWDDSNYEMVVTDEVPEPHAAPDRGGLATVRHPYGAYVLLPIVLGAAVVRKMAEARGELR